MPTSDQSDGASPTPTLRNVQASTASLDAAESRRASQDSQLGLRDLGMGRPAAPSHDPRPQPAQTESTPSRWRAPSEYDVSTDDEDYAHSPMRPYTALPGRLAGESSQRRPAPATSFGTSFGSSPHLYLSGPPRKGQRSQSVQAGTGTGSRSASRARPPLNTARSKVAAEEDDEDVEDRGAALIRERQKERKQLRKAKEREESKRRLGDSDPSAPQTGVPEEGGFAAQQRAHSRSVSRVRTPSVNREARADYFYTGGAPTPANLSPRDERHAPSVHSEEEDEESIIADAIASQLDEEDEEQEDDGSGDGDEGVTLRDRQDAINIEHPFGLPIWKPALYRKSRTVTRNAESALHSIPSAAAERHLLPGNIVWIVLFGWWLTIIVFVVAMLVSFAEVLGGGRGGYGKTLRGLAWYIGWPFGKYVEGEGAPPDDSGESGDDESGYGAANESAATVRCDRRGSLDHQDQSQGPSRVHSTLGPLHDITEDDERAPLLKKTPGFRRPRNKRAKKLGRIVYWPLFILIVAPVMLFVCVVCWGCVITIPMAKLNWALLKLLAFRPMEINFRSAPKTVAEEGESPDSPSGLVRAPRLTAGQVAPTAGPTSTVLLCTYRAIGLQYYKYTIGGVNIMFINLLPLVFFTIFDGMVLLPAVERSHEHGKHVSKFLAAITSQALIFILGLASVIPLSYFIGMAVASISAQSSIGMGAVINATFGSVIEIILYSIALTDGKGRLVEGSIVGSILAGVLLMPGMSMVSGALKRKEQKFNAKSAGVTSTMLIMAIIGTLTPTMFYQTYGSFELRCEGCPADTGASDSWKCNKCYYEHPDPATDEFYQDQVKTLMYACAAILLFSYLIGLWFSLRTHAAQIWQNPQQLMQEHQTGAMHPSVRQATLQRVTPAQLAQHLPQHRSPSPNDPKYRSSSPTHRNPRSSSPARNLAGPRTLNRPPPEVPEAIEEEPGRRLTSETYNLPVGYTPVLETVDQSLKQPTLAPMRLPPSLTTEDFTRAVAVATVSALRHQGSIIGGQHSTRKERAAPVPKEEEAAESEGGGHDAPSWTRGFSAGVLLACTLLYALIAEILVDVVDVVLNGSGIDEKFLGLTLFALVPNTTEFMNAMSFAMTGNIALSMEIGSAYALQVCLLQIPAMVAFSALYDPRMMGEMVDTFTLVFPRWDVIAIILAIFLLTYTYIEARSNYHRGSILVLAYIVLILGFYYAPERSWDSHGTEVFGDRVGLLETLI